MTIVALTFAAIVALVLGTYWILVALPEDRAVAALRRRMRPTAHKAPTSESLLQRARNLSAIPVFNAVLGVSSRIPGRLQRQIDTSGLSLTVGRLVLLSGCCVAAGFLLFNYFTRTILVSLLLAVIGGFGPYLFVRYKATKRLNRFEEIFPEAIGLIIRSLRAGHAFTTGLATVAEEIGDPVGPEFRVLYDHQNFGMPLDEALKALAQRIPLLDVRFFVTAVLTQRDAGGNLAEVLENIASVIRDRFKVKRQVRVVTAHARMTGGVLTSLPIAAAVGMWFLAPEHIALLWKDPLGVRMLFVAIVLQVIGGLVIRRLVRIEY